MAAKPLTNRTWLFSIALSLVIERLHAVPAMASLRVVSALDDATNAIAIRYQLGILRSTDSLFNEQGRPLLWPPTGSRSTRRAQRIGNGQVFSVSIARWPAFSPWDGCFVWNVGVYARWPTVQSAVSWRRERASRPLQKGESGRSRMSMRVRTSRRNQGHQRFSGDIGVTPETPGTKPHEAGSRVPCSVTQAIGKAHEELPKPYSLLSRWNTKALALEVVSSEISAGA